MRDQCQVLCEKGNKDVEMKWDALLNFKELLNVSFFNWMFTSIHKCTLVKVVINETTLMCGFQEGYPLGNFCYDLLEFQQGKD